MKTALRGRASEDGSITLKDTSPAGAASMCAVCEGPHETPPLLRFMRGTETFIAGWRKARAS